jgi:hypothetical protein
MKNPAEEIVTAWLQECGGYFTMNNIKVPKKGGGMGAEIDILATNRKKNIWIEVSVSTNPRCNYLKENRFKSTVDSCASDFRRKDKNQKARAIFGKKYEKWLVYGKLALTIAEKDRYEKALLNKGIIAVSFKKIFNETRKLRGYRLDAARGYMNLFEAFNN